MSFSVNTNPGALIALQNLSATNRDLFTTQNRISTGLEVGGAKDDGAIFAIAQKNRADVAGLDAVKQSLDRGTSAVDVALAAGEAISDLLIELKAKVVAATDTSLDTASRNAIDADFQALKDQIANISGNAVFNGVDLIGVSAADLFVLANDSGSVTFGTITVTAVQLTVTALGLATADATTAARAVSALADVEAAIATANTGLANLGTASKKLSIHNIFVGKLQDVLEVGIGNLVDADLAKESANLQALQIQQQLGTQALGIANGAPQILLGLFR
ncbi:MAG: flagellin [Minwuiales bacterium]|nr:flagellin [Minwuiales bacterium]